MKEVVVNSVQKYRTEKEVTQEIFGEAVGVTRQTVIAIEKGNYTPSVMLAIRIAKYFSVSVEDLFIIKPGR